MRNIRSKERWGHLDDGPLRRHLLPMGTSRRDCWHVAASRGLIPWPVDWSPCLACWRVSRRAPSLWTKTGGAGFDAWRSHWMECAQPRLPLGCNRGLGLGRAGPIYVPCAQLHHVRNGHLLFFVWPQMINENISIRVRSAFGMARLHGLHRVS